MMPVKAKFQLLFSVIFFTLAVLVFPALSHFTQATREYFKKKDVNLIKDIKSGISKRVSDYLEVTEVEKKPL